MHEAARLARIVQKVLEGIVLVFALALIGYAGFRLYASSQAEAAGYSGEYMAYKPDDTDNSGDQKYSLQDLKDINPDVIGWITLDNTRVDQPLVQGKDDMEYINKDASGEFSLSGAIFLSARNSPDFTDSLNIIYGHNMDNGGMFGDLQNYLDQSYLEEHTSGTLTTLDHTYKIHIFSVLDTDASCSQIYFPGQWNGDNIGQLLEYLQENSVSYINNSIPDNPVLIALSTCSNEQTNERTIVIGWLELTS